MSVNVTLEDTRTYNSLTENKYILELFSILNQNGKETEGLSALITHVSGMEDFVRQAEQKLTEMKTQLETMKEIQAHPVKSTLQKAIKSLKTKIGEIKNQIVTLKEEVITGCKNAVAAVKDSGIMALDKMASFFHIKDTLSSIKNSTIRGIDSCDIAIAKIESFSKEYHTAGRAIKNMIRLFLGKNPSDTIKEPGNLTNIATLPYKAEKHCLLGVQQQVTKLVNSISALEQMADTKRNERGTNTQQSTLIKRLTDGKKKAADKDLSMPSNTQKSKESEL